MKTDRKNTPESKPVPQPKLFKRVVLHTAIATAVLTGAYGRNAYAGSCSASGNTLVCSGAADPNSDVTQEIISFDDSVVMTTEAGFGIETINGSALQLTGSFSFTDAYQSLITGQASGIDVASSGDISITTTGTVTGVDNDGIHVFRGVEKTRQGSQVGALTINAANVYGGNSGITAYQQGSGALTINTTGTVSGGTQYGISALNKEDGTDTTITAVDVHGEDAGIFAHHYGAGTLSISSSGTVTAGEDGDGIVAMSYDDATGSTVTAGGVNAGGTGIFASHGGTGNLSITSTGTVTAGGDGINANSNDDTTGSTITSGDIDAGGVGISANHSGTGSLSITTGNIESVGAGVSAVVGNTGSGLTITSGAITSSEGAGILLENYGSGAISITATGSVLGQGEGATGIHAYQLAKGTDLVIDAQKDVTGDYRGIHAENNGSGLLSITSTGAVTAGNTGINAINAGSATTITAGDVSAGLAGIAATQQGEGSLSITSTGTVTGESRDGIRARVGASGTDLIIDALDINAGENGIEASNDGSGNTSITANGTVTAEGAKGINAVHRGAGGNLSITAVDVHGEIAGIAANHYGTGTLSISSSGTVTAGEDGSGIVAISDEDSTGNTITVGDVNAGDVGIYASHSGTGNLSITSTGTVTVGGGGIEALSYENATGSTITSGDIDAGGIGISAYHRGTGSVSITTGNIESVNEGISVTLGSAGSDLTITSGAITSSEGTGILLENYGSGAISITATGSVLGQGEEATGIHAYQLAKGTDLVIDAQKDVTGDYEGIHAENNGSGLLSLTSTGAVTAGTTGINAINAGSATTITAGDVSAGLTGIAATQEGEGSLSITSTGTVTGESLDGIRAHVNASGTDLTIHALDINAGENGIAASNNGSGNTSITANGTVTAKGAKGINAVHLGEGGNLSITAHNTSGLTFGIDARNEGTGSLSITSTGTASGGSRGISALSKEGSTDAIVSANNAYGAYGVAVSHYGSGEVSITTSGNVVGESYSGIAVFNSANGTGLSINSAGTVTSESYGIEAFHNGSGEVEIHNSGIVTATNGQALILDRSSSFGSVGGIISNSGSLTSDSRAAVLLTEGFDFSGEFSNQGDIAGGNGIAFDASANQSGFVFTQQGGQVDGDLLLGRGDDRVTIQGGAINGDIVGQGNDDIVVDLAADTAFTLYDMVGVRDFSIRNGRVNQAGDFSAVNTKIESGASMAFDTLVNGTGNLVVDGELHFSDDGKLVQDGSVILDEGSQITLDIGMSQYFDLRAEVIEASELIDNGAKVEDNNSLLFDLKLSVDSGIAAITSEVADLGAVSGKANASAFGNAVAAQAKTDRNFDNPAVAVLANLGDGDVTGFEQAADSFSPSVSGAIRDSAQAGNTIAMDAVRDRLLHASRETAGLPQQFWLGGFSGSGEHDAVDEVDGFESETSGAVFGYDRQWQMQNGAQWQAGAALATSSTDTDNNRFAADAIATDSSQFVIYSGYSQGNWQWQGAVSLAALEYDLERNSLPAGESTISGETEGSLTGLSATASYALEPYSGVSLRPLLTLQYSSLSVDEFSENGGMGLTVEYEGIDTLSSELGIDAAFKSLALGNDWMLAPQARISWSHEFLAEVETATARFGDQVFIQSGFEPVQDRINVEAGVELVNDRNLRFSFDYRGKFAGDFNSSQATLGMRYAF